MKPIYCIRFTHQQQYKDINKGSYEAFMKKFKAIQEVCFHNKTLH